ESVALTARRTSNVRTKRHMACSAERSMASQRPRDGVVLLARMGTRLGARGPKCLVEVRGTSILQNALEHLAIAGIRRTTLVVGYQEYVIRQRLGPKLGDMHLRYCSNDHFGQTG